MSVDQMFWYSMFWEYGIEDEPKMPYLEVRPVRPLSTQKWYWKAKESPSSRDVIGYGWNFDSVSDAKDDAVKWLQSEGHAPVSWDWHEV